MYFHRSILFCLFIATQPILAPAVLAQEVLAQSETTTESAANATINHLAPTTRASLKTITFQATANLSDTLIFGLLTGADAMTGMAFLVANTASAMAVYFPYELGWNYLGPPPEATTTDTIVTKTAGYQAITGIRNLVLSYAFSGTLASSATFVIAVIAVDSVIYMANEYVWDWISPRAVTP